MSWFDPSLAAESLPALLRGAAMTIGLTVPILMLGMVIAIPVALGRLSEHRLTAAAAFAYVAFFRGTPSLILLYLVYSGLGVIAAVRASFLWPVLSHAYPCAVIGFALVHSAYVAEILRGGLAAVPTGVVEAGRALGFSPARLFFAVRLPMAGRLALKSYQNEVVIIIKSTAAVSAITVTDLMAAANEVFYITYDPFTPLLCAAGIYWVMINLVRGGFGAADRRLNAHLAIRLPDRPLRTRMRALRLRLRRPKTA
ncbi:ABC transporter permease subunit [Ancylobacter sp. 6x-1]|uniref:ABC transporter permease subunit n=1 Tax=Ancylobacter crimeensis TaxID=2579147 RepID=A0ABT0DE16_9HYPH|nr:ABC transporter permease subunit [Ancylobacter crimeensis]MCK0198198.1 ABC transporter permease subunit [Ancylobacter crimeensis]